MKHKPETKEELKELVDDLSINLGNIDTSKITDMSKLFFKTQRTDFSGIEKWDVSNVEDMGAMFAFSESFNQDISNWDISNVRNMYNIFRTLYSQPYKNAIFDWDLSNVKRIRGDDRDIINRRPFRLTKQQINFLQENNIKSELDYMRLDVEECAKEMGFVLYYSNPNDSSALHTQGDDILLLRTNVYDYPLDEYDIDMWIEKIKNDAEEPLDFYKEIARLTPKNLPQVYLKKGVEKDLIKELIHKETCILKNVTVEMSKNLRECLKEHFDIEDIFTEEEKEILSDINLDAERLLQYYEASEEENSTYAASCFIDTETAFEVYRKYTDYICDNSEDCLDTYGRRNLGNAIYEMVGEAISEMAERLYNEFEDRHLQDNTNTRTMR